MTSSMSALRRNLDALWLCAGRGSTPKCSREFIGYDMQVHGHCPLESSTSGQPCCCLRRPLIPNSLVQQRHDLTSRNRPTKKIPLRFIALILAQESQLLFSLNPFRHDLQVQHMAQ